MSGEFDEGEKLIAIPAPSRCDRDVRPQWKCFCCCDGGLVDNPYLSQLVSGKNGKPFICQRLDCKAGEKYRNAYFATDAQRQDYAQKHGGEVMTQQEYQAQWDIRLTVAHCEQMHLWHKRQWDAWAQERSKQLNYGQSISNLTQQISMQIEEKC
ncbi:hypothetical protein [Pseudanabaena sp. PCC 6802]|uniref:hypothetical protein n=1 Tax=Pseudanabaena sp. PCC 6802 TaxID=118173 RepID=UPI0003492990|nr:hypothetical protein [Pseudanabaena sp. PCC 6802]